MKCSGGICIIMIVKSVKRNQYKENCKHRNDCKLYVMDAEEG